MIINAISRPGLLQEQRGRMLTLKGKGQERLPRLVLWNKQDQVCEEGEKQVHKQASMGEAHFSLGLQRDPYVPSKRVPKKR